MTVALELPDAVLDDIARRAAALIDTPAAAEPWLTVEQAAAHLGLSKSQMYTLSAQHKRNGLPRIKEGSRSYFKASELDSWRASR
ncbi:MAG TPA: helix-turn-helix domain-containing protein [Solirubrobacteraceae bacterium]|jgi:excisionase family DNA binding protein